MMTDVHLRLRARSVRWLRFMTGGSIVRRLCQNPGAVGSLVILAVALAFAACPTLFATHDPLASSAERFAKPGTEHLLGTDNLGRDVYSRIVYGSRTSMIVGGAALGLATIVGSVIGLVSGYFGKGVDLIVQRVIDAVLAFPALVLAMALVAVLGPGLRNAIIAISVTLLPTSVRVVRAAALTEKSQVYTEAAMVLGAGDVRIMFRHVLPNVLAPILVLASVYLGAAILLEATLGYLGLGAQPPSISWGSMLNGLALRYLESHPLVAIFPGLAISLTVLALSMLGDALRDILDPRLRHR
jgi:peptide/nickel transport system permease protein